MNHQTYVIEASKPFSESLIWQLNRDYYQQEGIEAWSKGTVPHHLTSNSLVGKTYAELIFAFLKDLSYKGKTQEKVYILELGAGHGRLAFHVLKHLERLTLQVGLNLPPYCYVLSDIVEENLNFFDTHFQFQPYFDKGILDITYFDAIKSKHIFLRRSNLQISSKELTQPLLVIANYFFDSIPKDLFLVQDKNISECSISLQTHEDPNGMNTVDLLKKIKTVYEHRPMTQPYYEDAVLNEILEDYRELLTDSYLFFPHKGFQCLENLRQLSQQGLMLLSIDKGFHELEEIQNVDTPEMVAHGSMSFWVNFHAFGLYAQKRGGKTLFPAFSNFHLELACLFLLPDSEQYTETQAAYHRVVNEYGPDDFNGFKKFSYKYISKMKLPDVIGMLRLGAYDSALFVNVLPRIKQTCQKITPKERTRLSQTMHETWNMYFSISESNDLAFEIAGIFYQLGYYKEALIYFQFSINLFGYTSDIYYNRALCYYQLRQDSLFLRTVKEAKLHFPLENFEHLDSLDLGAV
ncbi:MAG: SAM-dependent methyltransferase [Chitinophagales bacterium]